MNTRQGTYSELYLLRRAEVFLYISVRILDIVVCEDTIVIREADVVDKIQQVCSIVEAIEPFVAMADMLEHLLPLNHLPEYDILERFTSSVLMPCMLLDYQVDPEN